MKKVWCNNYPGISIGFRSINTKEGLVTVFSHYQLIEIYQSKEFLVHFPWIRINWLDQGQFGLQPMDWNKSNITELIKHFPSIYHKKSGSQHQQFIYWPYSGSNPDHIFIGGSQSSFWNRNKSSSIEEKWFW